MPTANSSVKSSEAVEIFTDGACRGNPGPGGWGALLRYKGKVREIYGGESETTNNRMELMAAIKALSVLRRSCVIELTTDSQYLRLGIMQWLPDWKKRGWKTSSKKPVKNVDLWQQLEHEVSRHTVIWHWVKGHAGHPENDIADGLANRGIDELKIERVK